MATGLAPLKDVERLSPRVIRILGGNPGKFTLQGTNTYLVGQGSKRILIDTAQGFPAWQESLERVLKTESATVERVLLTHWHHDHIMGVPDLLQLAPDAKIHKNDPSLCSDATDWLDISPGQKFTTEGATLRALHCPGHTSDHMALVLEEEDAMFMGDNVLGHGTAVFEDYATYMSSLSIMSKEFNGRAYPGHGAVIDSGKDKVNEYIAHRQNREKQVMSVMASEGQGRRQDAKGWTAMEIVKIIYKDYPDNLHEPAERGIRQILDKLKQDGKAWSPDDETTWLLGKSNL